MLHRHSSLAVEGVSITAIVEIQPLLEITGCVCQIADVLDVSTDWLLGRSSVMDVPEVPEPPKRRAKNAT